MHYLSYEAIARTPLEVRPFAQLMVPSCIEVDAFRRVAADFPSVPGPGSHPLSELSLSGHFAALIEELQGDTFRRAIETKFAIDLSQLPTMCTVRGYLQRKDGSIHTDSKTKIITVLLYLNDDWSHEGSRLRLLRSGTDLEDYFAEVPATQGTLLVFRRADNSWHGHKPYEGPRRAVQFNWVTSADVVRREQSRHRFSTRLKRLKSIIPHRPTSTLATPATA